MLYSIIYVTISSYIFRFWTNIFSTILFYWSVCSEDIVIFSWYHFATSFWRGRLFTVNDTIFLMRRKGGGKLWISRWRGVGDALHCIGVVKIVVIVFSPFMPWLPHKLSPLSSIRERACICVNANLDKCRHRQRYVIIFVVLPLSSTLSVPSLSSSSSTSSSLSLL